MTRPRAANRRRPSRQTQAKAAAREAANAAIKASDVWTPVVGWPAYHVSRSGEVYSTTSGKVLTPRSGKNGYQRVNLHNGSRKGTTRQVHSLVAEAWLGPRRTGREVDHVTHAKDDNRLQNLRWLTPQENLANLPPTAPRRRLTFEQAEEIRRLHAAGEMGYGRLARRFGVSKKLVTQIVRGESYCRPIAACASPVPA